MCQALLQNKKALKQAFSISLRNYAFMNDEFCPLPHRAKLHIVGFQQQVQFFRYQFVFADYSLFLVCQYFFAGIND
jgi:hypothetical protein